MFRALRVHHHEANCIDAATDTVVSVSGRPVPLTERTIPDAASKQLAS